MHRDLRVRDRGPLEVRATRSATTPVRGREGKRRPRQDGRRCGRGAPTELKDPTLVLEDASTDLLAQRLVGEEVRRDEEAASTEQENTPQCKKDGRPVFLAPPTVLKAGTHCIDDGGVVLFASTLPLDDERQCKEDMTHRLEDAPHSGGDRRRILFAQPTVFEDEPQIPSGSPLSLFALHELLPVSTLRLIASLRHRFASHRHSNPTHRFHEER